MSARSECLRLIKEAGGHFFDCSTARGELRGDAETGNGVVWEATDCHSCVINFYSDRPEGWKSLLEDLRHGTRPCEDPECEFCADPDRGHPCGDPSCLTCEEL